MARTAPHAAFALLLGTIATAATIGPAMAEAATTQRACLADVAGGKSAEIVCHYPLFLTEQERSDIQRLTRDHVQDASCMATIRIARDLVERALGDPDGVFEAPPQPVACSVATSAGNIEITGTVAPRVVFRGGVAVEGSPRLANVQGVHAAIAWPVVAYVNSARSISQGMAGAINTFIARRGEIARLR